MPTEVPPTKVSDLAEKTDPAVGADRLMVIDSVDGLSKQMLLKRILPFALTGGLLWRWNKTDLTQFDSLITHQNLSAASSGSAAATVVDRSPKVVGNVIRFTSTSVVGGRVLLISASELIVPARYVVVARLVESGSFLVGTIFPHCDGADSTLNGFSIHRNLNSAASTRIVSAGVPVAGPGISSGGAVTAGVIDVNGVQSIITVNARPDGGATALSSITMEDRHGLGGFSHDGVLPTATTWNSQDHDRIGIGCYSETSNSGTLEFSDLAVYAHPDD